MACCRVVGPRGLCRPLDEKQGFPTNTSPLTLLGLLESRAKGDFSRFRAGQAGSAKGRPGQQAGDRAEEGRAKQAYSEEIGGVALSDPPRKPRVPGICQPGAQTPLEVPCLGGRNRAKSLQSSYTGGFTSLHRSDETLGRGPRSKPRAPMQMVSGALGSLGLRVLG